MNGSSYIEFSSEIGLYVFIIIIIIELSFPFQRDCNQRENGLQGEQAQRPKVKKRRRAKPSRKKEEITSDSVQRDESPQTVQGVPRFRGVLPTTEKRTKSARKFSDDEDISRDNISDIEDYTPAAPSQVPLKAAKALASLIACYSDSDEEENALKESTAKSRLHETQQENNVLKNSFTQNGMALCQDTSNKPFTQSDHDSNIDSSEFTVKTNNSRDGSVDGSVHAKKMPLVSLTTDSPVTATVSALVDKVESTQHKMSKHSFKRPQLLNLSMSKRKLSLLEKLLAKDIRHERNILLQCVDFVVKNNFFDKMNDDV